MDLRDKVAIITGSGGGGTGRATARLFAAKGAIVVVNDINESGGRETVALIESAGGRAVFSNADAGTENGIQNLFAFTELNFGGVDVLVNNASSPDGLSRLTGWMECMRTEVLGPMQAILSAIEIMRRRGGGAIVNIGSTSALGHGAKHSSWPSYDAAKMTMMRLTTTLGVLRDEANVRVNCLVPSWIASPAPKAYWESLTPEQRRELGVPSTLISLEEAAGAIFRLATDESLYGRIMVWWNGELRSSSQSGIADIKRWKRPGELASMPLRFGRRSGCSQDHREIKIARAVRLAADPNPAVNQLHQPGRHRKLRPGPAEFARGGLVGKEFVSVG